jgi:hypothetical protein
MKFKEVLKKEYEKTRKVIRKVYRIKATIEKRQQEL